MKKPSVKKVDRNPEGGHKAPKPRFTNPVLGQEFEKQLWRQRIVAANKAKK